MTLVPLAVAVIVFALAAWLLERRAGGDAKRRIAAYVASRAVVATCDEDVQVPASRHPIDRTAAQLRRLPGWSRFEGLVERADLRFSAVELFWILAGGTLFVLSLAGLAGLSPLGLALLVVLELIGVRVWLPLLIQRRRRRFEEHLPEFLSEIASALRAGHGFNQALIAVAAEAPEPIHTEFERVINETRLGRPLEDALVDLGSRIESAELDFVIDAVVVQRQVGGSLAGIFAIVAESVRQRQQFALKVRSLTAMGRISALTVFLLPLGLAVLLSLVNHSYLTPLFAASAGRMLLAISALLLTFAALWLRKLVGTAS